MNVRHILTVLIFLVALPFVSAASYYYKIINPNDYAVTDYQLRIDLNTNIPSLVNQPISQIYDVTNNQPLNFCYEQSNLECSNVMSDTGYIWVKIDSIPAKDYIVIRIDSDGSTNGATTGDNVFDFYDDFNDGVLDTSKWSKYIDDGTINEQNGELVESTQTGYTYVYSNFAFGPNLIFETRVMTTSKDDRTTFVLIDTPTGAPQISSAVILMEDQGWGEDAIQYNVFNGGDWGPENDLISPYDINTYYLFTMIYKSDRSITLCADSQCATEYFDNLPNLYIRLSRPDSYADTSGGEAHWDWVRVRKYIDQELVLQSAYSQSSLSPQTASSQTTTFEQTYDYVKIKYVAGLNPTIIENIAIPIVIDTQKWINEGKLQSDCSDLYVTYYDPVDGTEKPAPYFIDKTTCNTPNTIVYVKLPQIASDQDITLFIYHGVPGTALPYEDPKNTFYFFVDLSNPTDVNNNLDIFTSGTASYEVTDSGIHITTGSDGYVAIYNK